MLCFLLRVQVSAIVRAPPSDVFQNLVQARLWLAGSSIPCCCTLALCSEALKDIPCLTATFCLFFLLQMRKTEGLGVLMGARVVEKIDANTQASWMVHVKRHK